MIEPIYTDRWIDQHANVIFRTCRRHTSSEDAAWEAFQETCLAYTRRRDSLDLDRDPEPWLRETARRCCKAVIRKQIQRNRNRVDRELADVTSDSPGQTDLIQLKETSKALHEELELLPREDRELLRCLYVDGMTHLNAARELQCSAGSVHARAELVKGRLRRRMERRGITIGALLLLFLLHNRAEAGSRGPVVTPEPPKRLPVKIAIVLLASILGALSLSRVTDPAWGAHAAPMADDQENEFSLQWYQQQEPACATDTSVETNSVETHYMDESNVLASSYNPTQLSP